MAFVSGTTGNEAVQKFLEVLQNDFRNLGQETKKKYPQIKEVSFTENFFTYCYCVFVSLLYILTMSYL